MVIAAPDHIQWYTHHTR